MQIRRLVSPDADAFQNLRLRALRECPTAFGSSQEEEQSTPIAAIAERLAHADDRGIFGAFDGAELIGTIGLGRESQRKLAHKAFIWGMYVAPPFRKTGIGHQLLSEALSLAASVPDIRQVNLYVNTANSAAIVLYELMGFKHYGLEHGALMVDGELQDELLMVRFIERS